MELIIYFILWVIWWTCKMMLCVFNLSTVSQKIIYFDSFVEKMLQEKDRWMENQAFFQNMFRKLWDSYYQCDPFMLYYIKMILETCKCISICRKLKILLVPNSSINVELSILWCIHWFLWKHHLQFLFHTAFDKISVNFMENDVIALAFILVKNVLL